MKKPMDCRKSLLHPDRLWNWGRKRFGYHARVCEKLFGHKPAQPLMPNPDDEPMVMLYDGCGDSTYVKYVRDMTPADYHRISAWMPSKNEFKEIMRNKSTEGDN